MAYAALVSVSQTLEQILDSDPYFFPCSKEKVQSFQETIASLIAFLDNCPPICTQTVNNLITQIRDSAYEVEDAFESLVATHFLQKYDSESCEKLKMLPQSLEKMMEDIESVKWEIKNFHHDRNGVLEQRIQALASSSTQLVSVLKPLMNVLVSDPYFFPTTKEKAVESCKKAVASLISFLHNFPLIYSRRFGALMTQIRDSTDDVLDVTLSLSLTRLPQKHGSDRYEKLKMFSQSLENAMEDIESVEKEVKKIHHDGNGVHKQRIPNLASSSRPASRGNNTNIVALDNDLETKLIDELVGGRSKIGIVSIAGMGGIGKTTLARILYNSHLIKDYFDIHVWVTISQTYNVREIVLGILNDIGVPLDENRDIKHHLYQSLYDRKYLIVLDDVWSTQAWDDMKKLFPDNNNGSRIILTTRHTEVAAYADAFSTYHEMQLLNEDSSWRLLCQEIFLQNNCPPELVKIGSKIARQCQGLPLAISAIGGHLRKEKPIEEYWRYVSENVSSVLKTTDDPSLEILTLSYNYLPHHLKACFLYFGSFQEDHPIDVSRIIKLWVAEGFVKPSRLNSMEEVAEEYLRDVIERNLIFVSKYDSFGKPKICGIHDLFRDICIRETKREKFFCILNKDIDFDHSEINNQRRLILSPNMEEGSACSGIVSKDGSFPATRSVICHGDDTSSSTIKLPSGMLKILIIRLTATEFPVKILELVNLKYLELGYVLRIPSSISRLKNLQTLIAWVVYSKSMPSEIWEMPQLRHLLVLDSHLPDIRDVQDKGTSTYVLKSLQTLSKIIDFRCTQEVVTRIPNLKKLNIAFNRDSGSLRFLYNLAYLCELESLHCSFHFGQKDCILPNLAFPLSLKKLVLVGCQFPWEQMTVIGVLPKLEVLKLKYRDMEGKFWETNDEEFKQLKFLLIQSSDLVEWKTEKDHFPSLRHLILKRCFALDAIPFEIGEIPTLEIIELDACSPQAESSAKEMLGEDNDIELIIVKS